MGQQVEDNFDFDGAFSSLQDAFRQKYGRDFTVTGSGKTRMHRRLSGGRARDIRSRDLSDDERQFVIDTSKSLGLDVVDQSTQQKRLRGSTGTHIHVGKYLSNSAQTRRKRPQSNDLPQRGVPTPPLDEYQGTLDSILSDYGLSGEKAKQQPSAPPAPPAAPATPAQPATDNQPLTPEPQAPVTRPEPPKTEPVAAEPLPDYTRQLDSILQDYGLSEAPPPPPAEASHATKPPVAAPQQKPRLFEQPDSHERVAQLRQQHPAGVPVKINIGDLVDTNSVTDEGISDRVLESPAVGMTPDEATAFKKILAGRGRGLPFKLSDPNILSQLQQHRDPQGNITLHLSPDALITYQDYLASMRERTQRETDNQGAINGTIGQRSPFVNESVNINARDPNSVYEKAEQRLDPGRVMITYKSNRQTEHATAAEASPDAGTVTEEVPVDQLGPQDTGKMVMLPIRAGGLLSALDKGQINQQEFLERLRERMMGELGFDEESIAAYKSATGEEPIKGFADQGTIAKKGSQAKPFEGTSPDAIIASIRKNGGIFDNRVAVPHYLAFKQFLDGQQPDLLPRNAKSDDVFDPESVAQLAATMSAVTGSDYETSHARVLKGLTAVGNFGRGMLTTASGAVKGAGLIGETLFTENRPSTWLQEKGTAFNQWSQEHTNSDPRYENFWTKDLAQGAGSMFTFMVAGLGANAAGLPQWLASASVGAASQSSEVYDDAIQAGMNHAQAMQLAKWGALIGTSEALGMGRILNKVPVNGFFAKAVAVFGEMAEEGAQEFGQNVATNYLFGKPLIDAEAVRAGAVGALLGFAGGAIHEAIGGEGHEGVREKGDSPIPNLSIEQYNHFIDRMSQVTGYPKEAIPGLLQQEVLRAHQAAGEGQYSGIAPTAPAQAETDAQAVSSANEQTPENISPEPAMHPLYVQSPDGRIGSIQVDESGKAQFQELSDDQEKEAASFFQPHALTAEEFDGLFPTKPDAYQEGTVELGRLQFLHDQGLLPESLTENGAVPNLQSGEQAAPATGETARPGSTIQQPGAEENTRISDSENPAAAPAEGDGVQAPGRSVVDEAIYNKARELVTQTRLVSPAMLVKKLGVEHEEAVNLIYRLLRDGVIERDEQGKLRVPKKIIMAPTSQSAGETPLGSAENVQAPGQEAPAEAPPEPAPKGWQIVEGKEPGDKYQQVRVVWRRKGQRAGRLYINTAAHDLLSEVFGVATGRKNVRFDGMASRAENVMGMATAAAKMSRDSEGTRKQALEHLAKELRQAANDELHIVVVNSWDKPSMKMRGAIRHEETHRAQRLLERATNKLPTQEGMEALPHIRQIRDGLVKRGYANDLTVVTFEAAAHIAAGDHAKVGISVDQAVEFMHGYFELVKATYGDRGLQEFTHLLNRYREVRDSVIKGKEAEAESAAGATEPDVRGLEQGDRQTEGAAEGNQQGATEEGQQEEDADVIEARAIQEQLRQEREQQQQEPAPAPPVEKPAKTTKPRAPRPPKKKIERRSAPAPAPQPQTKAAKPTIAADDEINGLLDQLQKIKGKQSGKADMSIADFSTNEEPALDELVVMVKLMRAYAARGVTDFSQAVELFQQHYESRGNPRAFDRALEIGWERLAAKSEGKLSSPGRVIDILGQSAQTTNKEGNGNGKLAETNNRQSEGERPADLRADEERRQPGELGAEDSGAGENGVRKSRPGRDAAARSKNGGNENSDQQQQPERPANGENGDGAGRGKSNRSDQHGAQDETPATAGNYRITNPEALASEGIKTKFRNNIEAIELLDQLRKEARLKLATRSEQDVLARYTGWGAMAGAFNTYDVDAKAWTRERDHMQELLKRGLITKEEYDSMKRSTINAHYTSGQLVQAIWKMIGRLGFKGGAVLEPAVGIGNFLGLMPPEMHGHSKLSGVEKEQLAGDMATALYPRAHIQVTPFERSVLPDNFYDLVISNVPFADVKILSDRKYRGLQPMLHDYYFLKSLDKVRPGGLVAFITSMGTMDKEDSKIREALSERADLVVAIRLPGETFKKNAGTDVSTDLLILRKRLKGEEPAGTPDWIETTTIKDPDGGKPITVNQYFASRPAQILGTLDRRGTMYRAESKNVSRTADFNERLEAAIARLPENFYQEATEKKEFTPQRIEAPGEVKDGGYQVRDGKLFQRDGGELIEREAGKTLVRRIEGHLKVRDALREVFNAQLEGKDDQTQAQTRDQLNTVYEEFVKKNGFLHEQGNLRAFAEDPDAPVMLALENWDAKTKTATKTDVFVKPTLRIYTRPTKADDISQALGISLNERGAVDLERMGDLLGRDQQDVARELVDKGLAYRDPVDGWQQRDIYLSGNVRKKLNDAQSAAASDEQYKPNVDALEKVQPADIPIADIEVRVGSTWVPASDYADFAAGLFGVQQAHFAVTYSPTQGRLYFDYSKAGKYLENSMAATQKWGTARANFADIMQAALDSRALVIKDRLDKDTTVINEPETDAANQKVQEVREAFRDWVWKDDQRRKRLHRYYNDNFNNIKLLDYDGSHLQFPGMNPAITLFDHQKNAVWQTIVNGKAIYGHEVGTGKTFTMIAAAMELKRLGLAKKPAIAVLKDTLPQFVEAARTLYPNIKLINIDAKFDAKARKRTVSRVATGDWDLVILTHENVNMLPMSADVVTRFIDREIDDLEAAKEAAKEQGDQQGNRIVKRLEKAKEKVEQKLRDALDYLHKDDAVTFEETGIDQLFVDEFHYYKSLPVYTAMQMKGIPTARSDRATNMFMIARWLQETNDGRGIVGATGTPISNSMVEMFTLQRYFQLRELEERGIDAFDSWASTFGEAQTEVEYKASGEYAQVERFSRFVNLPELAQLTRQILDVQYADDMPNLIRPVKREHVVESPMTIEQKRFMKVLQSRAELLKKMGKPVKGGDNFLKLSSDARNLSGDMRLVRVAARDARESKVNKIVANVLEIHRDHPGKSQLIFSDIGVHANEKLDGFSLYSDIIDKLVAGGIARDQIINFGELTGAEKKTAAQRLYDGEALIGIGGSKKLGTGVNVQQHLLAVHHLDAPYVPSEVEQRDGRIWRQGNQNPQIDVFRYVTVGSFDTFMWQLLHTKKTFIQQVLKKGDLARTVEEEKTDEGGGRVFSYAEIKAISSGEPLLLEQVKLEGEVKKLANLERAHRLNETRLRDEIAFRRDHIMPERRKTIAALERVNQFIEAHHEEEFKFNVQGTDYTKRKDANAALMDAASFTEEERTAHYDQGVSQDTLIGHYQGWAIWAAPAGGGDVKLAMQPVGEFERVPIGLKSSFTDVVASIDGKLRGFQKRLETERDDLERMAEKNQEATALLGQPYPKQQALENKRQALKEVIQKLKDKKDEAAADRPLTPLPKLGDRVKYDGEVGIVTKLRLLPTGEQVPVIELDDGTELPAAEWATEGEILPAEEKTGTDMALLGAKPFLSDDLKPAIVAAAKGMVQARDDVRRIANPVVRSEGAKLAGGVLREGAARAAQRFDHAEQALRAARKVFSKMSPAEAYQFIDDIEQGRAQTDPGLQQFADQMRQLLDEARQRVQALGRTALQQFYQNYFPHIWKDPKSAGNVMASFYGKKPLEGKKSFLKKRSHPTFADGLAAGLEPVSDNPVDLVLSKLYEMNRYVMAHEALKELKAMGLVQFVRAAGGKRPDGWRQIQDRIGTVYAPPTVKVKEAFDKLLWEQLEGLAADLGITHQRLTNIRGRKWGDANPGGVVRTRFAGPESVLAHEIGHILQFRYNIWDSLFNPPTVKQGGKHGAGARGLRMRREVKALADLRFENQTPSPHFQRYVRTKDEKMAVVLEAYVHDKQRMQKIAPTVFKEFERFVDGHPELARIKQIKPSLVVGTSVGDKFAGGPILLGHYYAPEPVAQLVNNFVSPGLREQSAIFRAYLTAGNSLNQFQLGWSAFHLGFTSIDAMVSKVALGVEELFAGHPVRAAGHVVAASVAPVSNFMRGRKLYHAWMGTQPLVGSVQMTPELQAMVSAALQGGGRARMDGFYRTKITENMMRAFHRGNILGGLLRVPFALTEQAAKPIMEYIVPRQKLGVYADLARFIIERAGANVSREQLRAELGDAWDSVDNRMGQLVYDNLFWNRYVKDVAMATVRSVGWNLGTKREIIGGLKDFATTPARMKRALQGNAKLGERVVTHRMAYVIALPPVVMFLGGLTQYLMTGQPPDEFKDWFFPKTGNLDENGRPERVNLPSYLKDVYHYYQHPGRTLANKLHPGIGIVVEMLRNEDYYGTEIRNQDDPLIKQLGQLALHVAKGFEPMASRNIRQERERGSSMAGSLRALIGITPAPASVNKTAAEQMMADFGADKQPAGSRTSEEAERSDVMRKLRKKARLGRDVTDEARGMVEKGILKPDDLSALLRTGEASGFRESVKRLSLDEAVKVLAVANPKEKETIKEVVEEKLPGLVDLPARERNRLLPKLRAALPGNEVLANLDDALEAGGHKLDLVTERYRALAAAPFYRTMSDQRLKEQVLSESIAGAKREATMGDKAGRDIQPTDVATYNSEVRYHELSAIKEAEQMPTYKRLDAAQRDYVNTQIKEFYQSQRAKMSDELSAARDAMKELETYRRPMVKDFVDVASQINFKEARAK